MARTIAPRLDVLRPTDRHPVTLRFYVDGGYRDCPLDREEAERLLEAVAEILDGDERPDPGSAKPGVAEEVP